jgi:hypothetical protein
VRLGTFRFLGLLLTVDGIVVLIFGGLLFWRPPAPARAEEKPAQTSGAWGGVDASALGREVGELYLEARRHLLPNKRVELGGAEVSGNDVVLRLALKRPARGGVASVFPGVLYCTDCERQSCQFDKSTRNAVEGMARALPAKTLRAVAQRAGARRLRVTFTGAAADERIEPTEDEKSCVGANYKTFARALGFDKYANKCGAHACSVGGETLRVGGGDIDDPRKLACLRAFCLHRMSSVSEVDQAAIDLRFNGRLGGDDDEAARPVEIVVTLRDLAAAENAVAYEAFAAGYKGVVGDEGKAP